MSRFLQLALFLVLVVQMIARSVLAAFAVSDDPVLAIYHLTWAILCGVILILVNQEAQND